MVANKYAFLQITRRRFLNEWEAFKKVISRRNIRRRITIPLNLSNLRLLRRIPRTENILHSQIGGAPCRGCVWVSVWSLACLCLYVSLSFLSSCCGVDATSYLYVALSRRL